MTLPSRTFECREQGGDAMPLVIVGHGAGAAFLHRQPRLGAIQRLDLALFIDREHEGVVRRIDIEPDDVLELGCELRIVGQLELTHQMRPQAMHAPYPLHGTDTDPRRLRHRRTGPMVPGRRRSRQCQGDNPLGHFRAQRRDARRPRLVTPKPRRSFVPKPLLPAPDQGLGFAGGPHNFSGAMTIGSQKDDLCPPGMLLRAVTVDHTALSSRRAAAFNRISVRSCIPQTRTSKSARESFTGIEMSDLVH